MPKFVIEPQYLVPMYQHIVVEADRSGRLPMPGLIAWPRLHQLLWECGAEKAYHTRQCGSPTAMHAADYDRRLRVSSGNLKRLERG